MEALGTMKHRSPMRTRSGVSTLVPLVYAVGVGDRVHFDTTNMEDELQFSPKNASFVLPQ